MVAPAFFYWNPDPATGQKSMAPDVSGRLVSLGAFGPGTFDEPGFLGFTLNPDYAENGPLHTYTSEPVNGPADLSTMPPGVAPGHQVEGTDRWRRKVSRMGIDPEQLLSLCKTDIEEMSIS